MRPLLFACLLAVLSVSWASVVPVVSNDGVFKAKALQKVLLSTLKVEEGGTVCCPVVSILNLSGSSKSYDAINSIAGTSFKGKECENAINLDIVSDKAFLCASYSEMFSSKFCGAKAADFCGLVSDAVIVVLPDSELEDIIVGHDQTIRRIVNKTKSRLQNSSQSVHSILFVVAKEAENTVDLSNVSEKFDEIWQDGASSSDSNTQISCNVIALDSADEASLGAAKAAVEQLSTSGGDAMGGNFADKLAAAWAESSATAAGTCLY